ncbi:polcalcin Phl p 7 [Senna tora]|uniref:Polcalcin Phl p 7 n=1 Tax=Senna tora TaxID=362788 RepID=A0A834U1X2_9FABA|nr:polcalcin Phl p 7 [Senna tora]
MSLEEFKRWLMRFDGNGDGRISEVELREAVRVMKGWGLFSSWNTKKAIKSADANHDGFIDHHEFNNLIHFADKHLNIIITKSSF